MAIAGNAWWTGLTVPVPSSGWNAGAYGNGIFLLQDASGPNATSADGVTWTTHGTPATGSYLGFGAGLFVVGGSTTNTVWTTPDGITYTTRTIPGSPSCAIRNMIWDGSRFVLLGLFSSTNYVSTSPDGITWSTWQSTGTTLVDLAYGNGIYVFTRAGAVTNYYTSTDLITFTSRNFAVGNYMSGITFTKGTFCAFPTSSGSTNRALTSTDGINWTAVTLPTGSISGAGWDRPIVTPVGRIILISDTGPFPPAHTSDDGGLTWTANELPSNRSATSLVLAAGLTRIIAAEQTGTNLFYSPPPQQTTTWNQLDKGNTTLSNGNLTTTAGTANYGCRTISSATAGKWYIELTLSAVSSTAHFGFCTNAVSVLSMTNSTAGTFAVRQSIASGSNNIYSGSATVAGTWPSITVGCAIAIDLDARLVWVRNPPSGLWNNSGTADPATGVGGIAIASTSWSAGTRVYGYWAAGAGVTGTLNAGGSAFVGAVPAGFNPGFGALSPDAQLTQAALEQWGRGTPNAQATQVALEMWGPGGATTPRAVMTQITLEQWASVQAAIAAQQARAIILA